MLQIPVVCLNLIIINHNNFKNCNNCLTNNNKNLNNYSNVNKGNNTNYRNKLLNLSLLIKNTIFPYSIP